MPTSVESRHLTPEAAYRRWTDNFWVLFFPFALAIWAGGAWTEALARMRVFRMLFERGILLEFLRLPWVLHPFVFCSIVGTVFLLWFHGSERSSAGCCLRSASHAD